jgi:hypothetical protein
VTRRAAHNSLRLSQPPPPLFRLCCHKFWTEEEELSRRYEAS